MERKNQKTKSVGNGEGTLYKSKALDCWVFQYYDTNNKRQTMKQRKNESTKDFKIRVTEIKNSLNNNTYICKSNETVISIAEHYIEQKHIDGITSARSYKRELETLEQIKKTCSSFCYIPIQNVTITHIENAKSEIKKYANETIDKIWRLLFKTFKSACSSSRKILTYNIMEDEALRKPISEKKTKKVTALSDKEYEKLLNILDNEEKEHPYRNIVKMQGISGMRIGEVVARSEDDYNKNDKTFYVHNTLTQDENYNIIWSEHTKTYNKETGIDEGKRFLPLDNRLFIGILDIIKEEKKKKIISINNVHNVLFWDYKKDSFISPSQVNSWLNRIDKKYHICENGILSTHRLRHYALTHWRNEGVPLDVIQYLAGHSKGSNITKAVYIDNSLDYVRKSLDKIS